MEWQTLRPATANAGRTMLGEGIGDDRFPPRSVRVHLPPGYEETAGRYPVLYLHDGENAYGAASRGDKPTWGADRAADDLAADGFPVVIVAIDSGSDRIGEYSPWHEPQAGGGGDGAAYVEFIRRRVKPLIEADFAVNRDAGRVGSAGSSLGGLLSLFTVLRYPAEFGSAPPFRRPFGTGRARSSTSCASETAPGCAVTSTSARASRRPMRTIASTSRTSSSPRPPFESRGLTWCSSSSRTRITPSAPGDAAFRPRSPGFSIHPGDQGSKTTRSVTLPFGSAVVAQQTGRRPAFDRGSFAT